MKGSTSGAPPRGGAGPLAASPLGGSQGRAGRGGLRREVRRALDEAGVSYEVGASPSGAGGGRADFLVGGVALRCVSRGSLPSLLRRLRALASSNLVEGIVVVTTRNFSLSDEILGKPMALVRAF